jgi:two-component sensor histidine kinase
MSILIEGEFVGMAEADHRIANNLAGLSGVIRLQRNAISRSNQPTFTTEQVCMLLDDVSARIEVTAKLHKSLALATHGNGVNLGDFLQEIAEMIGTLGQGKMDLTIDHSCNGHIDPRHALHAGLITAELLTNASKYAHPTGLPVTVHVGCEAGDDGSFAVEVTDDGVGFPENFDPATDGGLGFQLMRALANGLGAELQFEHSSLGVCGRLVRPKISGVLN